MELQTFTFFLLAFVALSDGAPRDMDDSIDMNKPERAKAADLARARTRRQEPGGFEPFDLKSEEALNASSWAMDWYNEHSIVPCSMDFISFAEKKIVQYWAPPAPGVEYQIGIYLVEDEDVNRTRFYCTFDINKPENYPPHVFIDDPSDEKCTKNRPTDKHTKHGKPESVSMESSR